MRILVLYGSHFGRTCAIATSLAQHLREYGHRVDVADAKAEGLHVPPDDYDAVIIGSRVEIGRFAGDIVDYIREYRVALSEMPTAFFSVSLAGSERAQGVGCDPNGYNDALFDHLDWHPTISAGFAGGLPYRQYGWLLRQIMKRISKAGGHTTDTTRDHVFTDDMAIATFGERFATTLVKREVVARA